jgi:hypothetical protein
MIRAIIYGLVGSLIGGLLSVIVVPFFLSHILLIIIIGAAIGMSAGTALARYITRCHLLDGPFLDQRGVDVLVDTARLNLPDIAAEKLHDFLETKLPRQE